MDGILRRLSTNQSEAEDALRVVAFFDRLVAARAGVEEIVRSSAQLTGLSAGLRAARGFPSYACTCHGQRIDVDPPPHALTRSVAIDGLNAGTVWLVESDDVTALAELVLERMTMAAESALARRAAVGSSAVSPLTQLLEREVTADDRIAAARAIGFRPEWQVRAITMSLTAPENELNDRIRVWARQSAIVATPVIIEDYTAVCLVHDIGGRQNLNLPAWPFQVGIGERAPLMEAFDSSSTARLALRLTSATIGPTQVDYEQLGPLQLIASIDTAQARASAVVQQLMFLAQSQAGLAEVVALDRFCEHRSLRKASVALNLHHTSVNHRLKNIERKLGMSLTDEGNLFALSFAMKLFRIAAWDR